MTELLQVLMYFFAKIGDGSSLPFNEHYLISELKELGISQDEIQQIMSWINRFTELKKQITDYPLQNHSGTRIFTPLECQYLNKKYRSLLLGLEQKGILTPATLELVLDHLMYLDPEDITIGRIKFTILMVLSNQPDKLAIASMERFLLNEAPEELH